MDYQSIADKLSSVGDILVHLGTQQDADTDPDRWIMAGLIAHFVDK